MIRDTAMRWKAVGDLLTALERIIQANLILDTKTRPFRMPADVEAAERAIERFGYIVDAELDRLTSERLTSELKVQRLTGVRPVDTTRNAETQKKRMQR